MTPTVPQLQHTYMTVHVYVYVYAYTCMYMCTYKHVHVRTYNGVRGMVDVVDPAADGGGDEAGCSPVALPHHLLVVPHHDEQGQGRPHRKEVLHLTLRTYSSTCMLHKLTL